MKCVSTYFHFEKKFHFQPWILIRILNLTDDCTCRGGDTVMQPEDATEVTEARNLETSPVSSDVSDSEVSPRGGATSGSQEEIVRSTKKTYKFRPSRTPKNKANSAIVETKLLEPEEQSGLNTILSPDPDRGTKAFDSAVDAEVDVIDDEILQHEDSRLDKSEEAHLPSDISSKETGLRSAIEEKKPIETLWQLSVFAAPETWPKNNMDFSWEDRAKPTVPPAPIAGSYADVLFGILTVGWELVKFVI